MDGTKFYFVAISCSVYAQSLETEAARLEAKVEEQRGELVERGLLISQLERLGSSLREEALELRLEFFLNFYFRIPVLCRAYHIIEPP
jgi:hypothetical protein